MSAIDQRSPVQVLEDAITKKRVLDGIALLEEHYGPDWASKIDLNRLSLCSAKACVLGQLYDGTEVPQEKALAYSESPVGRNHCFDDDAIRVLNDPDMEGFTRGLAMIDGPLLEPGGATRYGFDRQTMIGTVRDLSGYSDNDLEDLGVTREMVDDALRYLDEHPGIFSAVGVSYTSLDHEWSEQIRERQ